MYQLAVSPEQFLPKVVMELSQLALGRSQLAEEAPYKLVELEGKGRGLVATRPLEIGELVLSEKAFLKTPLDTDMGSFLGLIEAEPDIRAKLMNLSCSADAELGGRIRQKGFEGLRGQDQMLLKKFWANCISVKSISVDGNAQESAVFEMISMINHSCMPNVIWFPEEADETRKEVRVCRRIQEGEEIVASYLPSYMLHEFPLRQQRRDMLVPWGFVCRFSCSSFFSHPLLLLRCELCMLSGDELEKNEELRRRLMNLERESVKLSVRGMKAGSLKKIEQKMEMMEKNWDEFGHLVRPNH